MFEDFLAESFHNKFLRTVRFISKKNLEASEELHTKMFVEYTDELQKLNYRKNSLNAQEKLGDEKSFLNVLPVLPPAASRLSLSVLREIEIVVLQHREKTQPLITKKNEFM